MNESKKYFIFSLIVLGFVTLIFLLILIGLNADIDILFENQDILFEHNDRLLDYLENEYPSYIKSNIKESIKDSIMNFLR